jgi:hypothetical protein
MAYAEPPAQVSLYGKKVRSPCRMMESPYAAYGQYPRTLGESPARFTPFGLPFVTFTLSIRIFRLINISGHLLSVKCKLATLSPAGTVAVGKLRARQGKE